jgi:hypothetical protein
MVYKIIQPPQELADYIRHFWYLELNFTYEKHFARALKHLDTVMLFIHSTYNQEFSTYTIQSPELHRQSLNFFKVSS